MKISLHWLNDYLAPPAEAHEVETLLTQQGLPIASREPAPGSAGDVVLDVEVTSNRSDCLGHVGLAREVAAGSGRRLTPPKLVAEGVNYNLDLPTASSFVRVTNQNRSLCPLYTARVIIGVKVGPSPAWLVERLAAVGVRSVNNVVDVTNYVMFELGQPLHAFDLDRLAGRRVVVRTAADGEPFVAIDGSSHRLRKDMLVIADAEKPVAVAGVMGGRDSEIALATTNVLLESARFDPLSVRRTSRTLKLSSDSSYRFERGVDPLGVEFASRRAAALIVELAGGTLAEGVIREGADLPAPRAVALRLQRCNELLGTNLTRDQIAEPLGRLGLGPRWDPDGTRLTCAIPTYRLDLSREVDLIEEVARLRGYDAIPVQPKIEVLARPVQASVAGRQVLSHVLVAHGYYETITFSFTRPEQGRLFVPCDHQPLMIEDERRKSEPMLRPSLLPSLLACRKSNQDVGNEGVRLFECAATWSRRGADIVERNRLGLIADAPEPDVALRQIRGAIEELLIQLQGGQAAEFTPEDRSIYATAAMIRLGDTPLGHLGLVALAIQRLFDLQTQVVAAELDLDALLAGYPPRRNARQLPRFPGIERDLSVVVAEEVRWSQVHQHVLQTQPALLEEVRFIGTYRGKPVPPGRKSVTFRMVFRDPASTLRHEQVDPQVHAVVEALKQELGAELRA
jgi:phenylalanyl-tRNA synthetase beta chain